MKFVLSNKMRNMLSVFLSFFKYNKRLAFNLFINYYLLKRWIAKNKNYKKTRKIRRIKKIIFLIEKNSRESLSVHLAMTKGFYPSGALRKKGIVSEFHVNKLPKNIENTMIVFIKCFPYSEVTRALRNNCIIVYEIMDIAKPFLWEIEGKIPDAIIFPNKRMKEDFKDVITKTIKSFVIYHHWDPRLDVKKQKNKKKLSLAYFGTRPEKNAIYYKELSVPVFTSFLDHIKHKDKFNCLYSMRKEGSYEFLYKPSTKVATAAAIGANIITSKEPSAVELLGKDYPYLTDTDFESVKKTIEYAKETFGKKVWSDALKTMKEVKKRTDINNIVDGYIKIAENI